MQRNPTQLVADSNCVHGRARGGTLVTCPAKHSIHSLDQTAPLQLAASSPVPGPAFNLPLLPDAELMTGGALSDAMRMQRPFTLRRAMEVAIDTARGLAYMHNRKPGAIIHRDLKPGNLMISGSQYHSRWGSSVQLEVCLKVGSSGDSGFISWLITGCSQCHSRWRSCLRLEVCCEVCSSRLGGLSCMYLILCHFWRA